MTLLNDSIWITFSLGEILLLQTLLRCFLYEMWNKLNILVTEKNNDPLKYLKDEIK